jgi:hypothetical protein
LVVEYVIKGLVELAEEIIGDFCLVTHNARDGVLTNSDTGSEVFLIPYAFHVFLYPTEGFSEDVVPFPHKSTCLLLK